MQLQAVNNCSSFQIQPGISHFHPQALSSAFRNFHWKSARFHGPPYGWIPLDYKPLPALRSVFKINLKANFEGIVLLSKAAQTTRNWKLAEVQFVIDSCRFVSQSNYLNNSNKDCDWHILACFIREQCMADATFARLENKVWFENSAECVEKLSDSLS